MSLWMAVLLGLIEGLTEYLPVSSTGHLIVTGHFLGLHDEGSKAFEIVIQVGAIAAVLVHFRTLLWARLRGLFHGAPASKRLLLALILGFLPTAVVGLLFRKFIKRVLFGPVPVAVALIVGGLLLFVFDRLPTPKGVSSGTPAEGAAEDTVDLVTPRTGLLIGLSQCFALFPGASRSLVTLFGGRLAGLSTKVAAEFSFLLALPTLGAAAALDLVKERQALLSGAMILPLLVGLFVSFVVALLVIRLFLSWLGKRGLWPFGVYRVVLGVVILLVLK